MPTLEYKIFDSHLHIIDYNFPIVENNGYQPNEFTFEDYLNSTRGYRLVGGAIVSGSFQKFDQSYLLNALQKLGSGFVGVTQLPNTVSDKEILFLNSKGVRAVRFNLKRGGSEDVKHLAAMASRVHDLAGWHVELYVDSIYLNDLTSTLVKLPSVSVDHLGLSAAGLNTLCRLVEKGIKVKATGFGRVDFDVASALEQLHSINPTALMFGSDLPSTRAPKPYSELDLQLVIDTMEEKDTRAILSENARQFYRLP